MVPRGALVLVALTVVCLDATASLTRRAVGPQALAVASSATAAQHVDRARLMRDLQALVDSALEGRRTGTPGGRRARAWIESQFAEIGLTPAGSHGYLAPFQFSERSLRGLFLPGRPFRTVYDAANILGRIEGTHPEARAIVVSAHYDHLGVRQGAIYPGADDNASGVAAVLAVARQLKAHPPRHPLLFIAFDAEELQLRGARAFIASRLMPAGGVAIDINLDMLSRSDANEIYAAGLYHHPWLEPIMRDVQRRSAVKILFGHDRPARKASGMDDWTFQSDHGAFHEAGIPFLYFGVADHEDYHRPTDTVAKISPQFFGDVADLIVEAVTSVDRSIE